MQHVYKGYKNLCNRVIDPKATTIQGSEKPNGSLVYISQSASQRFERLGDRIDILILSEMEEYTAEKESLISTVFTLTFI
jgi:aryl-alcohol dehydrogenase-like predicted oxidoreductase